MAININRLIGSAGNHALTARGSVNWSVTGVVSFTINDVVTDPSVIDHSTSVNNERFYVYEDGAYELSIDVSSIDSPVSGLTMGTVNLQCWKNGSGIISSGTASFGQSDGWSTQDGRWAISRKYVAMLSAGDYVHFVVSGSFPNGTASCLANVIKLT